MTQTQIVLSCSLLRSNVEVKNPASSTIVRFVRPPGMARRMTLRMNLPSTRA